MFRYLCAAVFIPLILTTNGCYDSLRLDSSEVRKELDYHKISFIISEEDGSVGQYKTEKGLCSIKNDTLTGRAAKILNEGMMRLVNLNIPTSRIRYFEVEDLNTAQSVVLTGTIVGGAAILIAALADNDKKTSSTSSSSSSKSSGWGSGQKFSCPLIYTFGDSGYKLESETFAGALFKGIERSSYDVLSHIKPLNGKYSLKLVNAREETEYVNQLKLILVYHPNDVSVIPDYFGNVHSVSNPLNPLKAFDKSGKEITEIIYQTDKNYFESNLTSVNVDAYEELIDNLTAEFPKPKDAKTAKIIVSGLNTELAYFALEKIFAFQGEKRIEWFNKLDSDASERAKFVGWLMREGMLHLSVWDGNKWSERGAIPDVGPGVEKTQITLLNVADITGDLLKLKIAFRSGLWRINQVAVDYSDDCPVKIQELTAYSAVNEKGKDISNFLLKSDSAYYVTVNGEFADIEFSVPQKQQGVARTVIAKTQGFYNQWGLSNEEEQPELVERILTEPLFGSKLLIPLWFKENAEHAHLTNFEYE